MTGCVRCARYGGGHIGAHVGSWEAVGNSPPPIPTPVKAARAEMARADQAGQCARSILGWWKRLGQPASVDPESFGPVLRGFQEATVWKARRQLGVKARPTDGRWAWDFPVPSGSDPGSVAEQGGSVGSVEYG